MEEISSPINIVAFGAWFLSLLLNANDALRLPALSEDKDDYDDPLSALVQTMQAPSVDMFSLMRNTVQNYRLCCCMSTFHKDLTFWVKPRSTTWFSRFLLEQYDSSRWISMFRMTKPAVFALAEVLCPHVEKKNTKYRVAVPVLVRVACTLFKLTHGANLTVCSELFAIGRSTMSKVLHEVVTAINVTLRHEISWPTGDRLCATQAKFSTLCALPAVVGAIDGMHVSIAKPDVGATDYYYFKTGGYSMNCQAVVDSEKRFLDLYVGMPGSTNDSHMLRRSSLHYLASHANLLDAAHSVEGFTPYVIGDLGYPLLPWLLVPHRGRDQLSLSETLFNKKLRKGRCVVENAFGILKQSFRELLNKSDLKVTFLPDVILCCALLHNVLLRQSHEEIEEFLHVLRVEGFQAENGDDEPVVIDPPEIVNEDLAAAVGSEKRSQLGVFLTT